MLCEVLVRHIKGWALLLLGVLVIAFSSSALAADKRVSIGYIATYTPWMAGVASGLYDDATGYDIQWREYGSGIEAIAALSRGEIQLSHIGITPVAGAVSAGMALELFWVVADIDRSEALVVRRGSGIVKPQDLRRKRLAAPIGSTAHFHLLFALDQFGIPKDAVEIVNMSPAEIGEAWRDGVSTVLTSGSRYKADFSGTARFSSILATLAPGGGQRSMLLWHNPNGRRETPDLWWLSSRRLPGLTIHIRRTGGSGAAHRQISKTWSVSSGGRTGGPRDR